MNKVKKRPPWYMFKARREYDWDQELDYIKRSIDVKIKHFKKTSGFEDL